MQKIKHIKKGDQVVALSGACLGQNGKVIEISHKNGVIKVDGIGIIKKHTKPSQENPKGGIIEGLRWWPACKFMVCDAAGKAKGRTGFSGKGKEKKRVYSLAR